ncbi:2-oxoisovalerate dehydrogenase subunit beta [Roseivivax jejudonensis]|uniref:Pyruvate dehydrogenase E1 component subunit beta n=1 Tax=Roseivivax jejudonensis TaxID=1529041 RepID=A0A1X6ZGA9_9RHOB|nr:pyruvate dehydrogenase complex E1 component subunit beta [Roseivivax jejudonensis]SLN50549.1 2-oxoisovalerate dehydrogenase subunit beta [Roseivivax jejudonensis]
MATEIRMPALSPAMEEGRLSRWFVAEGDAVEPGDVIAEIETDKATLEFEAVAAGRLDRILVPEGGDPVKVDTPIALLVPANDATRPAATAAESAAPAPAPVTRPRPRGARAAAIPEPGWPAGAHLSPLIVREALRDALTEEMRRDESVFVIGEEVGMAEGPYRVTQGLLDAFGAARVIDTPVTEAAFAGIGVGAAFAGQRPVVEFMNLSFALQAMDQIVNSAAFTHYMSGGEIACPIVFRGPNGAAGRVGAQHAMCFAAWFAHIPGLRVVYPYAASDAKGLLKAAIRDPNPVIFLENERLYGKSFEVPALDDHVVAFGRARIWRSGGDVTLASYGPAMAATLEAAEALADDGIEAEVIDLRTLRPLDVDTVAQSVTRTHRLVTVEEGWPQGGIGAHLAAEVTRAAFDWLDAPVASVTGADVPMPYAETLERAALPCAEDVIAAVRQVRYR